MKKGISRDFFAGGNTAYGFYSLFHYIAQQDGDQLYIIKGGPGTGKSTLMKQIGKKMQELGHDTELFHCSSDQNSLDGVAVPALGLAIVDGTAPHIIDPKIPGAYDEIVNLGDCWDRALLRRSKSEISSLIKENGNFFIEAYQYLKEAHIVMEKNRYLMSKAMDFRAITQASNDLIRDLAASLPPSDGQQRERHLFAGAITPGGFLNFYPSILDETETFYLLTGDPGSGKSHLLKRVYETVSRLGNSVDVYHCAFDPERIDCLVIPSLKTAFVKGTYPHTFSMPTDHAVREQHTLAVSRYARVSSLKRTAQERSDCQERFWYLTGKAIELIGKAKNNHDQLEEYYIRAMDFDRVANIRDGICARVLTLAGDAGAAKKGG